MTVTIDLAEASTILKKHSPVAKYLTVQDIKDMVVALENKKIVLAAHILINRTPNEMEIDSKAASTAVIALQEYIKNPPATREDLVKAEKKADNEKGGLIRLKVSRDTEGLQLYIESEAMENFIRRTTAKPELVDSPVKEHYQLNKNWPDVRGYHLPNHTIFAGSSQFGGQLLINGKANMALLCIKGIKDGVTLKLKGLYTDTQIREFLAKFRIATADCYREFMKPFAQEIMLYYTEL